MSKKITSILALALCATSAFGMVAGATTAGTEDGASASLELPQQEVVKPSGIEQQRIDDMLKKHGLDKLDLSFQKADFYSVFTDDDKAQIEKDAKAQSMRGILDATTMYVATIDRKVEGAQYPYQLSVVVFADLRTGLVNAAEIMAYPYPLYLEGAKMYAVDSKLETIDKDMTSFMAKAYAPKNKEHQAAKILGYEIGATKSAHFRAYFKSEGWNLGNHTVYQNPGAWTPSEVTPEYEPFLRGQEVNEAMRASANGGPQVMMMMSGSGFYFVEKPYRFKDSDDYFYIAFCASNGDLEKEDYHPTFKWLTVRPAKYNQDGTFDKFIYPVDTKLQTIVNDMSQYFKTGNATPPGAVN